MGLQSGFQPKTRFRIAHPELLPVAVDAVTAAYLAATMLTGELEGDYHFFFLGGLFYLFRSYEIPTGAAPTLLEWSMGWQT